MTEYKPGTVAALTHRNPGVEEFVAVRGGGAKGWYSARLGYTHESEVTKVRPLVVLDPAELPAQWAQKVRGEAALRYWGNLADDQGLTAIGFALRFLADQIEAQTKPPRIPEPGLWGVVEASCPCDKERVQFVQWAGGSWRDRGADAHPWYELIDPVLVREGV